MTEFAEIFDGLSREQLLDIVKRAYEKQTVREPMTYTRFSEHSFFQDLYQRDRHGDQGAAERLERHANETQIELRDRDLRGARPDGATYEIRTPVNWTPGDGGDFAPPLWLNEAFATAPRPKRVLAAFIPNFRLPQGVQTVLMPRLTTGTKTAPTQLDAPQPDQNIRDAEVASPVRTITGKEDVPLQLLEQSPAGAALDWALFRDLQEDYDSQLETQLLAGTGRGAELLGLINLAGINRIVYTDGAPTAIKLFASFEHAAAKIGDNRELPPELWLMRTARWAFLGAGEDEEKRPLAVPGHTPPPPIPYLFDDNRPSAVSTELGWPIFPDDAIPVNAESGQDFILAARPTDMLLLESEPRTEILREPLAGNMGVRLQFRRYASGVTGRYPSGVSVIEGTGLKVPAED